VCPFDAGKDPEWFLEVEAGDIDQRADSALNYVADPNQRRLTFAASGGLWSLRFPTPEIYRAFMTELEVRCHGGSGACCVVCYDWHWAGKGGGALHQGGGGRCASLLLRLVTRRVKGLMVSEGGLERGGGSRGSGGGRGEGPRGGGRGRGVL
jgi:hypothetical protein